MIGWIKDLILEIRIQHALNQILCEPNRDIKRSHANRMAILIGMRSERQIEKMERKAGLR
jgi:hypothetical protein